MSEHTYIEQSKKTVLYVGGFKMPDKNAAAHRVLNNAKIFKELGYNVVFCGVDDDIQEDEKEIIKMGDFGSCPSKYPHSNKEWVKALFDFSHIRDVISRINNISFVVAYNMHAMPLYNLIKYCKKKHIKIISDATEWYENRLSLNPKKMLMSVDTALVMRVLHTKLDGLIAISSYLTTYYQNKGMKVIQLPPLVDISEWIWNQKVDNYDNSIEFVYAGNRGRNKKEKDQLGLLVSCFSELRAYDNYILTVVGITENDFRNDYPESKEAIDSLSGRIEFKGRLAHSECIFALLKADYSVFFRERTRKNMAGFPTKFAEAVTAGLGIIANEVSNINDYQVVTNLHVTKTTNQDEISKVLEEILKNGKKINHNLNNTFDYRNYVNSMNVFLESC